MTAALEILDLRKTYDTGVHALKGVSLTVEPGDFFALLGPNGAGKSTLIGAVCSLVRPSAGSIRIFGEDLGRQRESALGMLGVVPQEINFNQFEKPFDIVVNQAGFYGLPRPLARERAERYLKQLSLWDKAFVPSRTLSGGMKRRLMIARAMVHEPKLLILDEPTAGVDIEIRRSMWQFVEQINRAGTTVILTTHYLEEAEQLCRNIAIIDKGEIIRKSDMKSLLASLDRETFVLDLVDSCNSLPNVDGVQLKRIDDHTLEAEVAKGTELNAVFRALDAAGIRLRSLRNKANRLEELFLNLVDKSGKAA
ncbi:ABC transporter [Ahniella affigens]|uniref:ABC transporter n=1 Tax=Ahniella affigens TaxID=2021234 RepID=A0A2P1PX43_9GAMM|nr:ABC transporter ATP-binding protein [Ahniella affigens]AVP99413.1 ABC transporter [Ahniella affigens]